LEELGDQALRDIGIGADQLPDRRRQEAFSTALQMGLGAML
jgi:uncharacterized protein YjiS (DUF1127 family)